MSGKRLKRLIKKYAIEIFSEPWLTGRFEVSDLHEADTAKEMIKKCGLSYHHYGGNYVLDTIVMYAHAEIKQEYVRRCCTKYLVDDLSEIIGEYLGHKK